MTRLVSIVSLVGSLLITPAVFAWGDKPPPPVIKKIPEIQAIKPTKPVNIKLRRYTGGGYSWEIRGDDVEKILETDRRLKEVLGDVQGKKK